MPPQQARGHDEWLTLLDNLRRGRITRLARLGAASVSKEHFLAWHIRDHHHCVCQGGEPMISPLIDGSIMPNCEEMNQCLQDDNYQGKHDCLRRADLRHFVRLEVAFAEPHTLISGDSLAIETLLHRGRNHLRYSMTSSQLRRGNHDTKT